MIVYDRIGLAWTMQFEWDDKKARSNKAKHKVDFEAVRNFDFDTALYYIEEAVYDDEERWKAIGLIGIELHTVIFTERGDRIRVISLREASTQDRKDFYER